MACLCSSLFAFRARKTSVHGHCKGLFLCGPVGLYLLKGLAGGLWDALPHYEEVRDAHRGEEEEGAGGGERLQHPRGELADQVGANPEGKSGYAHRETTNPVRVHL